MNYLKMMLLVAFLGLFLISCSEDDSPSKTNTEHTKYFDMAINSYWVDDNYMVDMDGNMEDSYYQDSTVVTDISENNGITVYELTSYVDGQMDDTMQMGEDDNTLYVYADFLIPDNFPIPTDGLDLPEGWITFYNKNMNSWNLIEDITVEDIPISGFMADATFNIDAEKNGTESLSISGESYIADKMLMNIKVEISVGTPLGTVNKSVTIQSRFYFVKGYGLVKIYTEPEVIDFTIDKYEINGFSSNTVDMSVSHDMVQSQ
jgi:hypothetical protein